MIADRLLFQIKLLPWRFFGDPGKIAVAALLVVAVLSGCTGSVPDEGVKQVVFRNVTVIDALNGSRSGQSVVVSGKRITAVGSTESVRVPKGSEIIDCTGKYMIPGLWDAHVHLTNSSDLLPAMFPLLIANGITYVRDTGATLESIIPLVKEAVEISGLTGMAPRVFITGPHLDGLQLSWNSSVSAVSVEQARFIINCLIKAEVDELKVYDLLDPEICLEVLSLAAEKGYRVSAHVPLGMDVVEASNAGLSSMEHMYNLEMACSGDWDSLLKARQQMIAEGHGKTGRELRSDIYRAQRLHSFRTQDDERRRLVLETLAANNTWQVPTLAIIAREQHRLFEKEEWRETFRYLPEPVRFAWEDEAALQSDTKPSEEGLAHAGWAFNMIPLLADAGVGIMAGTDMPLALLTPGFSLHEELSLLVDAGLTPMQALEAATLKPAEYYGVENSQGSIRPGMAADLVILDASPLDNISNTRRINAVMRDGHLHTRGALDKLLEGLSGSAP